MTDEEIAQLGQELNSEEKARLIRVLCGPAEDWDDAAGEFAMKIYGVDPNLSAIEMVEIIEGTIRKFRERDEEVPQSLQNVLAQLRKEGEQPS
jgi:DNA-binding GntR family transcriptional regulator